MSKFFRGKSIGAATFFPARRCSGGTIITNFVFEDECSRILLLRIGRTRSPGPTLPSSNASNGLSRLDHQLGNPPPEIYLKKSHVAAAMIHRVASVARRRHSLGPPSPIFFFFVALLNLFCHTLQFIDTVRAELHSLPPRP